jgi:3-oxoacyl-[acyl-carrier-protein] synthase II
MRRIVVTGLGLVTPLASGVQRTWERLLNGESGFGQIESFDVSDIACRVAAQVPRGDGAGDFRPDDFVAPKDQRKIDDFILFGIAAAVQAVEDSGWMPDDENARERTGVMIGSGIGGLKSIADASLTLENRGARRISPFFIPSALINLASGQVSIRYGFKGPNHAVVTACSTGAHAIGDATGLIRDDKADVMVAGGAEAAVCRLGMAGFAAARALSTGFNDEPDRASRPWDSDRDGFVMGEGAGIVVLEELEHAKKRGATIYAEVVGYGMSGDAHHITAPPPDGNGGFRAMRAALQCATLNVDDVDYINAHGTSTPLGDESEVAAIKSVFGDDAYRIAVSSTKSSTGHLLGAAGGLEAGILALALRDQVLPATLNLDNPSATCDLDFVPHTPRETKVDVALTNSFGFGGTNGAIVMSRFTG